MTAVVLASDSALPKQVERALADLAVIETPADAANAAAYFQILKDAAKKAGMNREVWNRAAEGKLRAERRGGEVLALMQKKVNQHVATDTLSEAGIAHHQSSRWQRIASIPDDDFEAYIASAWNDDRELTTAGALKLAKQSTTKKPSTVVDTSETHGSHLPGLVGRFTTIVADPPWQYDNKATRGAAEDHYATLSITELCDLPVEAHAADDAHLYLWTTNGFLREAFDVLAAWGFTYKTCLTWVKPQMGMGNYFRSSTEHVLFGTRGRLPTKANNLVNWFEAARTRHSAKPAHFYELVESASPGPFLEMFARTRRLGDWTPWGLEA